MEGAVLLGLIWVGIAIWLGAVDAAWRRWDSFHARWLETPEERWHEAQGATAQMASGLSIERTASSSVGIHTGPQDPNSGQLR